jgi:hypothetical protein
LGGGGQRKDLTRIDFVRIGDLILIGLINDCVTRASPIGGTGNAPKIIARLHYNALLSKGLGGELFALEGHLSSGQYPPIGRRDLIHPQAMPANAGLVFRLKRPAAEHIRHRFPDVPVIHIKPEPGAGRRTAGEAHGSSLVIFNRINAKPRRAAIRCGGFRHL